RQRGHPVGQRFSPASHAFRAAVFIVDEVVDTLALDWRAVDIKQPINHLDAVAWETDDAHDVIGGVVLRKADHDYVAALRRRAEDAAGKQRRRQRQGTVAVTVAVFRYE